METWHPLDDAEFAEWVRDQDCSDFSYGIYDSKWLELYDNYKEEVLENGSNT